MGEHRLRTGVTWRPPRRAAAACDACHERKVRCDALIHGQPCTNCRIQGHDDCVLRGPQNNRPPTAKIAARKSIGAKHSAATRKPLCTKLTNGRGASSTPCPVDVARQMPISDSLRLADGIQPENRSPDSNLSNNHVIFSSYRFLNSSQLSSCPPEDVEYLVAKGCLHVPAKDLLDEFVKTYFCKVHPFLPLVDEAEFWRLYCGSSGTEPFSLFVFQAMLFACSSFVSLKTLQRCGFCDKRAARIELYKRAKLLFDLKVEASNFAKAQGAVLLSLHTSAEDPKNGSLWLAAAIQIARPLEPDTILRYNGADKLPMIKRLWWSILLRDRSLSLGLRRYPQMTSVNFITDANWLHEDDFADEFKHSKVYNEDTKRQLFAALQEQCRLAVLLTDIVSNVLTSAGQLPRVRPKEEDERSATIIQDTKAQLIQWKNESALSPGSRTVSIAHEFVHFFLHVTYMYYYNAQFSIAQSEALLIERRPRTLTGDYALRIREIGRDLRAATDGVAEIMEYFSNKSPESFPLNVLAYARMPLVLSAIDFKLSTSYSQMVARRNRFNIFTDIIRHSRRLYDVTDLVAVNTDQILQLAYSLTKELFLGSNRLLPSSELTSSCLVGEQRATSIDEVYLRYPRAYLYISISVEYSLFLSSTPSERGPLGYVYHVPSLARGSHLLPEITMPPSAFGCQRLTAKPHHHNHNHNHDQDMDINTFLNLTPIVEQQTDDLFGDGDGDGEDKNDDTWDSEKPGQYLDILAVDGVDCGIEPFIDLSHSANYAASDYNGDQHETTPLSTVSSPSVNLDYLDVELLMGVGE